MAYYSEESIKKTFSSAINAVLKSYSMDGVLSINYHYEDNVPQTSVTLISKSGPLDFGYCYPTNLRFYPNQDYTLSMTISKTAKEFLNKIFEILDCKNADYYITIKVGELNAPYSCLGSWIE